MAAVTRAPEPARGELPSLAALRAALPRRCFEPNTRRSLAYLAWDLAWLALFTGVALRIGWSAWLALVWFAQGTLLWALFVIGHDCGHGAFSRHRWLNDAVGHLAHTLCLVPYHAWRRSHRTHHRFAGDLARDEGWFPYTEAEARAFPWWLRWLRFRAFLLVFPFYLARGTPRRSGNHFDANGALFAPAERAAVRRSVACVAGFAAALLAAAAWLGPGSIVRATLVPYLVFVAWIDLVTFLHHTHPQTPWFRVATRSPVASALAAVDRRYGGFDWIHHRAGWHTAHHLFPGIPHYRLPEATRALTPLLGAQRRDPNEPIWRALARAARCQVVPAEGDVVFAGPLASRAEHGAERAEGERNQRGSGADVRPATR